MVVKSVSQPTNHRLAINFTLERTPAPKDLNGSELGSYLAMAGAYGEFSPTIMMTGFPSTTQQASGESWHHMLGKHEYSLFNDMGRPMTAGGDAVAILTPENCKEVTIV